MIARIKGLKISQASERTAVTGLEMIPFQDGDSLNAFISTKGQPSGLAELDSTGKVPAAQLPSYVDDVLEYSTKAQFPLTGETGKIYVAKDTNLIYRWTGTQYLEISLSLALGETPSTAYPGDKGKANRDALNSMPTKLTSYLTPTTSTGELVKINYKYAAKDGLNYGPLQDDNIDIPSATITNAGAMSAIDKGRLDDLYNEFGSIQNPGDKLDSLPNNLVTGVDATSRNATSVTINYKQSDLSAASNSYANPITKSLTIPAATQSAAGVLSAADKTKLDGLNTDSINDISVTSNANKATITFVSDNGNKEDISTTIDFPISTSTAAGTMSAKDKTELDRINTANFALGAVTPAASTVGIAASKTNVTDGTTAANNITLPAATQSAAGVMTATDKQNLDVNIPNRITNLDNKVTTEVDRLEELIESSSSEITNDLNVEIQARKDGDNLLQTNINNLLSTMNTELAKKVGKVTVAGSGNAVTTASISGDTLTLTKGATYNNYVHPAGSAPSKASGFYKFSTDSTSHVASVTAVTKADITALGIPSLNTNTTYTFANGSAGNFTVTPSGGSALTVSVGKPANAGNADTVGGISPSAFVKKAGDTMTGSLYFNNNSGISVAVTADGSHTVKIGSAITGGWARGYNFNNNSGAALAAIGCTGTGQTFDYAYIGSTYNNTWLRWDSSSSVITVPLTTAAITSSGVVKTTLEMIAKYFRFEKNGTNQGYIGAGSTQTSDIYLLAQNNNHIRICINGYNTNSGISLLNNNNVTIGNSTATEKLNVAGNITSTGKVSAASGFFKESDARLKSDIKPLDYTLEQICSIPTVSFIMNDLKQIGTIALNLEELGFEDIVTEGDTLKTEVSNPEQFESFTKDGEEYVKVKKVEYEMLGVLAIEGVKMLKDEIEKLKAEIETLKNKQHE